MKLDFELINNQKRTNCRNGKPSLKDGAPIRFQYTIRISIQGYQG